ncbi:type VI lipase adapter Tla3 domain-containing protein [Pseudomonas sp. BLCC-B112]|uniref:type VI lipase adapter Tla3 domain-containing protein n=1 Tax=Pseudomonas sp. BLCC-B112 TaxID=3025319 RepID=UPI00300E70A0
MHRILLLMGCLLLLNHGVQAAELPLTSGRCFASSATPVTAYTPARKASTMTVDTRYRAPTTSPRLETLDVLSLGVSLDVFRQGDIWKTLQEQNVREPASLHVGSILPMDPKKYPVTADDKDIAYAKRKADALELGLRNFPEKWPVPTITVVRGWNSKTLNLRLRPERTQEMLTSMVNSYRTDAGLHWHRIRNVRNGVVCNDTPEDFLESLFQLFERNPDLPAVLIYNLEGFNMALALTTKGKDNQPIGVGTGPRQPGELTDAMVALVVGRPERVEWLRYYAPFTKVNKNKIDPEFTGWGWRKPAVEFQPSEFIPQPWTERAFEQWDALPVLARIHRPVTVSLQRPDNGERLKREALTVQLAAGWKKATDAVTPAPARVFYDGGLNSTPLAELLPALTAARSSLDLLDSREGYDLTQRLGDTGAASPFVGIALATMASYQNADTSVVMPLRRKDQATLITITSPTPGQKPVGNKFGINLMPQTASSDDGASVNPAPVAPAASRRPVVEEDYTLEEFLAELRPKDNWMDDL